MKNRTTAFLMALCLVSAFSLAQSDTDAPLTVSDPYATNAQPDSKMSTVKHHGEKRKDDCPTQPTDQNKGQHQEAQQSRQNPPQADMPPTI